MGLELEKIRDEIIGLRPVYTDTGNATIIYLRDGEVMDSRGIRSVQTGLARMYAIDLAAQRKQLKLRLNRYGVMPFYLSNERIFVPLKMRKPIAPKDMVYGYIDVRYMGEVDKAGGRTCMLPLKDGRRIEILSNRNRVLQVQHMGQRLLEGLQDENPGDPGEKIVVDASLLLHNTMKSIARRLERIEELIGEDEN